MQQIITSFNFAVSSPQEYLGNSTCFGFQGQLMSCPVEHLTDDLCSPLPIQIHEMFVNTRVGIICQQLGLINV